MIHWISFLVFHHRMLMIVVLFFILMGCQGGATVTSAFRSIVNLDPSKIWLEKVEFQASEDVNDDSPITVHLIIFYDKKLFEKLLAMDSETYFESFEQIKRDSVGACDFFCWDIVKGSHFSKKIEPSRVDGLGGLIFARYKPDKSPGPHRAMVGDDVAILVQLNKLDFKIIHPQKS